MSAQGGRRNQPPRLRFMPDVLRGQSAADVEAQFAAESASVGLLWTCRDCAYVLPGGGCSVGWPNQHLSWRGEEPPPVLVGQEPAFCKAYEPLWS